MTAYRKNFFILLIISALILFGGLNVRELFSGDETRVAGIMTEMHLNNNMVTPKLNGRDFLEYPPLYYQTGSLLYKAGGVSDAVSKLPSALSAFLAALTVFFMAKKMNFKAGSALCAAVLLLTSAQFFNNGRKCMVDMMLAFFVLWSIFSFYSLIREKDMRLKILWFFLYSCGLAGGFFTKGLIGFAFPWAGLGVWLVTEDIFYNKKFSFTRYLLLGLGVLPVLIPVALWAKLLYQEGGEKALHTVFMVNGIGRFTGSQGDHVEPVWYYFAKLPGLFQPWLFFFFVSFVYCIIQLKKRALPREVLPALCCAAAPFLMLLCASAKRQVYLLPIYPAWALVTVYFVFECKEIWLAKLQKIRIPFLAHLPLAGKAAGILVLAVFVFLVPGWSKIYPLAGIALLGGAVFRKEYSKALCLWALALLFCCVDAGVLSSKNKKESLRLMFERCREWEKKGCRITLQRGIPERTSGAGMYYMKKHLPEKEGPVQLREIRVIRSREKFSGIKYPDHHWLLTAGDNVHISTKQ